jgi:hypothetical protein
MLVIECMSYVGLGPRAATGIITVFTVARGKCYRFSKLLFIL